MTYGRTSGPSQPGMKKIPAAWTSTIAVRPTTYGVSHFRIGWYPSRRRLTYDVRPTRIGGVRKNHFIAGSLIKGGPFGVCHPCATTPRVQYKEAGKVQPSKEAAPDT